jgi:hypothetical protein
MTLLRVLTSTWLLVHAAVGQEETKAKAPANTASAKTSTVPEEDHATKWQKHHEKHERMLRAAKDHDIEALDEHLTKHSCHIDYQERGDAWTALHQNYNLSTVKHLIKRRANVDVADQRGRTPLFFAARWGQVEVLKELLKHAKNLDTSDTHGVTAIEHAAYGNHTEVVKLLKDAGANVERANGIALGLEFGNPQLRKALGLREEDAVTTTTITTTRSTAPPKIMKETPKTASAASTPTESATQGTAEAA